MDVTTVFVPGVVLKTPNSTLRNASFGARMATAKRARKQREWTGFALLGKLGRHPPPLPVEVTVVRVAPGPFMDAHDNLAASCKHVVDAIAEWLGVKDNDSRVTWHYTQRRDKRVGIEITIASMTQPTEGA